MLEIRTQILQTKLLCAMACKIKKKEDKSLRKTDGTDSVCKLCTHVQQFCGHSEASLGQVLQLPLKGTAVECSSTKNKNNYY